MKSTEKQPQYTVSSIMGNRFFDLWAADIIKRYRDELNERKIAVIKKDPGVEPFFERESRRAFDVIQILESGVPKTETT